MTARKRLTVLGATGSIGVSTLDVVSRHPERFEVLGLSANRRIDRLYEQCLAFRPLWAAVPDPDRAAILDARLRAAGCPVEVLGGEGSLEAIASRPEVDTVMAAIVGAAGLRATLAAARQGKTVLLANKESLVMAGALFMAEVRRSGAILLPIDSEHNAIYQSLPDRFSGDFSKRGVRRIILTASGGPFRETPLDRLHDITPDQACAHPNWVMGRKISVDSATMMNKGLEVIEAHWLFNADADRIDVLVHPQSVVHSMVEYVDGSVIAQLGNPDMRTPIAHALAYPERIESGVASLDLARVGRLTFERPDTRRFPCLALAYEALRRAGSAPASLNAANEVAVAAFLDHRLAFDRIPEVIAAVTQRADHGPADTLEEVLDADRAARRLASAFIAGAE
ncbi:MAG: 1-deoxy-D-xylulose-5-phosphate reductoisomerase [Rhodocyclaceae bacterium]